MTHLSCLWNISLAPQFSLHYQSHTKKLKYLVFRCIYSHRVLMYQLWPLIFHLLVKSRWKLVRVVILWIISLDHSSNFIKIKRHGAVHFTRRNKGPQFSIWRSQPNEIKQLCKYITIRLAQIYSRAKKYATNYFHFAVIAKGNYIVPQNPAFILSQTKKSKEQLFFHWCSYDFWVSIP